MAGGAAHRWPRAKGPPAVLLPLVVLATLLAHGAAKGSGGAGRSAGRASYGGGGSISRGYTRTYFFVYAGTRHRCSSCSRTTEQDSMSPEMKSIVVLAEFDVTFLPGTDLGSEEKPSTARIEVEQHIESRVAGILARKVPTVTLDDVSVRDSWRAPATCTGMASDGTTCDLDATTDGSADCSIGCDFDNSTVMYEVSIFTGEAGPDDVTASGVVQPFAVGAKVFNALRICGDCGELGASSATANGGATCAAEGLATVADTRLADCCNTSVLEHVAAFAQELTSSGQASGARISDCGNRTMEVVTLQSEVEKFGKEESGGSGLIVLAVLFGLIVVCCTCKKLDDVMRERRSRAERKQVATAMVQNLTTTPDQAWQTNQETAAPVQQAQTQSAHSPVVMGTFVGQAPPTVAQAMAKGQAMMSVQGQSTSTTHNPVPRQGP